MSILFLTLVAIVCLILLFSTKNILITFVILIFMLFAIGDFNIAFDELQFFLLEFVFTCIFFVMHLFYIFAKKMWIAFLLVFIPDFVDDNNLLFAIYIFSIFILLIMWIIYAIATFQNNFLNI